MLRTMHSARVGLRGPALSFSRSSLRNSLLTSTTATKQIPPLFSFSSTTAPKQATSTPTSSAFDESISLSAKEKSLLSKSLVEIIDSLRVGECTSEELTAACLKQAKRTNNNLNAFVTFTEEEALENARQIDLKRSKNNSTSSSALVEGIPIAVKDAFCTKGVKTTAASRMLHDFIPTYDAEVYAKLKDSGAIMIGKTNMDEYSMGSATVYSIFGPTINPWSSFATNELVVAGGSSGGSAAAVAARSCFAALGTDTGGSVRQPASYCGIVGLKASYGRCSRFGMIPYASSLDTPGIITRTVADAAVVLDTISGFDAKDSTSLNEKPTNLYEQIKQFQQQQQQQQQGGVNLKGLRVGIPAEYYAEELSQDILRVWEEGIEWLRDCGAEIVSVSLPHTKYALSAYYVIAPAECSSNLSKYDGIRYGLQEQADSMQRLFFNTRTKGFGDEVKRRIIAGTFALSVDKYDAYFKKAQEVRRLVLDDFEQVFAQGVHVILTPTTPTPAFPIDSKDAKNIAADPVQMYVNDIFTIPASLAGLPAMSVPTSISSSSSSSDPAKKAAAAGGLPLGLQLISNYMDEWSLVKAGLALESRANFYNQVPPNVLA